MKFLSVITLSIVSATVLFSSCAEEMSEDTLDVSKTAWAKWSAAYLTTNPNIKPLGNDGVLVEIVTPPASDALPVKTGQWVRINYTGSSLTQLNGKIQGEIYATRNKQVAEQQGTSTLRTHYVPQYVSVGENSNYTYLIQDKTNSSYSSMPYGQYLALMSMKQGERLRVYIPSYLAYGSMSTSFSGGYEGQNALAAGAHICVDMEVVEVIEDITIYQDKKVEKFAMNPDGWNLKYTDTLKTNLFVQRFNPTAGHIGYNPNDVFDPTIPRDSIGMDSTVNIYYVGKFLDGFIFDTNIDSIAKRIWNDNTAKKALEYKPSSNSFITAFPDAVNSMVYNECARMVFPAKYGYGADGSSGKTVIQPYSPLIFEYYIPKNQKKKK